ncbi:DUF3489 domain-containing protein [Novosphingobium sp. Chol11]|jgi:predicted ArsR family transcriptional regulator|uniref:DUF3489 domain-containing protein n=1 Tax=Novosphingobium sp. Chol11 TaxID=1385763 RepID=UPI000BE24B21|nr:DUF3489 domain-containing protein [Novosphingobium sp. Chol11]
MTISSTLTDIQRMLLTAAEQREDGSLLPLPEGIGSTKAGLRKELQALIHADLAAEVTSVCPTTMWRKMGRRPLGLAITDAGRAAVAAQTHDPEIGGPPLQQPRHTKSALVLEMLRREAGATLSELASATNWLPHTTRAALTGLRKKGHGIEKRQRGELSCYHLGSQA